MNVTSPFVSPTTLKFTNVIENPKPLPVKDTAINDVVWEPIPGSSQAFALCCPANIIMFDGPRGPGKTICQLMAYKQNVGIGYGPFWKGIIFDREHDNLSDMVSQSLREFPKFKDGAKFKHSKGDYKWTWPTGEQLLFRHVKNPEDYDGFHGHEYPFIGWNEITKYADDYLYRKLLSTNRSSFKPEKDTPKVLRGNELVYDTPDGKALPPIPLKCFITTNPNGRGHNWVKEEFIDPAPAGTLVRKNTEMFNPLTGELKTVTRTQVRIFGNFHENIYIDDITRATLMEECSKDKNLEAAWIYGDWSVNAGGIFDDVWNDDTHIRERFIVPKEWIVDRSHDWGSTSPYATIWWAEANGEEVQLLDGTTWCPPRGTLIGIAEDYGCEKPGGSAGLKLSVKDVSDRLHKTERQLKSELWVKGWIRPGPADNSIRNVIQSDVDTIETQFQDQKVEWTESDKSAGSRIIGVQLFRDRLQAANMGEGPAIYFTRNCVSCCKTIPGLPRDEKDPDDVDTESIDHCWDAARYRVLASSNRYATDKDYKPTWGQG